MSLFLDLPDEIVFNYVLLYIGEVSEMLVLCLVSKAFKEKVELLLPVIVELDLLQIDKMKADEVYAERYKELENFLDLKKMLEFRLKRLSFDKEIDQFDTIIAQGLLYLAHNTDQDVPRETISNFLKNTLKADLKSVLSFSANKNIVNKAEFRCVQALSIPMNISKEQRILLNWLTGALKLHQFVLSPYSAHLICLNEKSSFFHSRIVKISKYFGFSL